MAGSVSTAFTVAELAPWLVVAVGVVASWRFLSRGGGSAAIASLEAANRVLEKRVHELELQAAHDNATIQELQARTDIQQAIRPLLDWTASRKDSPEEALHPLLTWAETHENLDQERADQQRALIEDHEAMAVKRAERIVSALDLIIDRLEALSGNTP